MMMDESATGLGQARYRLPWLSGLHTRTCFALSTPVFARSIAEYHTKTVPIQVHTKVILVVIVASRVRKMLGRGMEVLGNLQYLKWALGPG